MRMPALSLSLSRNHNIHPQKQSEEVLEALEGHQAELQSMSQVEFFKDKVRRRLFSLLACLM